MDKCDLSPSCCFRNDLMSSMPLTSDYLKDSYCDKRYCECAIYMLSKTYGEDKVPRHLYPNDIFEVLRFDMFDPQGVLAGSQS